MGNITWTAEQIAEHARTLEGQPHFSRLNHISIAVRDVAESKRFYCDVLGGRLVHDADGFAEVNVAGTVVGMSERRGNPQASDAEYPHIGFEIESKHFLPMKRWLEEHGVKTHQPWSRSHVEGLMYFKDPSGNLIEIYCPKYDGAKEDLQLARTVLEVVDLTTLDYAWR